jgi:hypothetical protein
MASAASNKKSQFACVYRGRKYGKMIAAIKTGSATSAVKRRLFIKSSQKTEDGKQ